MKQIYVIKAGRYSDSYRLAFENRNDAVKTVCAMHEVNVEEAAEYIKTMPYVCDKPQTVNLTDVDTLIDTALKAAYIAFNKSEGGE